MNKRLFSLCAIFLVVAGVGAGPCDPNKCTALCRQQNPRGDMWGYQVSGRCLTRNNFCGCYGHYGACINCYAGYSK